MDVRMSTLTRVAKSCGYGAFTQCDRKGGDLVDQLFGFYTLATPAEVEDHDHPKWRGCRDQAVAIPPLYNPICYAESYPPHMRYDLYFVGSANSPASYCNTNGNEYINCITDFDVPPEFDSVQVGILTVSN